MAEAEVPVLPQRAVDGPWDRTSELPARAAAPGGVLLPKSVLILLIVFALAALGIAFFAGFLFGKQTATESGEAVATEMTPRANCFSLVKALQPGAFPHAC